MPDRCADIDPEALGLTFHQGPTFINAYIVKLLQTWLIKTEDYQSKVLPTLVFCR